MISFLISESFHATYHAYLPTCFNLIGESRNIIARLGLYCDHDRVEGTLDEGLGCETHRKGSTRSDTY